ncbi:MAG TPA: glucokinase [Casimicrobiaceae bacterium]|nr:glucokinase [Casimicrobiaceae bacterium]
MTVAPPVPSRVLAGDIGGTHARLALAHLDGARIAFDRREILAVREHAALDDALARFLGGEGPPERMCLAWAGPIDGPRARLTNGAWEVDADAIGARFGIARVALVNDFHAAAAGIDVLGPGDLAVLQPAPADPAGARLVIGAGTGLGVAYVLRDAHGSRIVAGEGGHAAFAPQDDEQAALWHDLHRQLGRVAAEHVLSGNGLVRLYRFCRRSAGLADGDAVRAVDVARRADAGDPAARHAMHLFCSIYGAVAGDHALACMATGGVYVAGGIAARNAARLADGAFVEAFSAKGGHRDVMARMPVWLVRDELLGLRGAAALALALPARPQASRARTRPASGGSTSASDCG